MKDLNRRITVILPKNKICCCLFLLKILSQVYRLSHRFDLKVYRHYLVCQMVYVCT